MNAPTARAAATACGGPPRPLRPGDVEAVAAVLAHVEGLRRAVARDHVVRALVAGARHLEVPLDRR